MNEPSSGSQYPLDTLDDKPRVSSPGAPAEAAALSPRETVILAAIAGMGPNVFMLRNARVLVTGAMGFFGRYVVDLLLELNNGLLSSAPVLIHALDSNVVGSDLPAHWVNAPNLVRHKHDVRHELGNPMLGGPALTHVWHLAGIASPYWYKKLPRETVEVAVDGTRNMLKLAREHGARFMFTSSSEVYQTADIVPTPEHYVGAIPSLNDRSCYDVSKLLAETLCYIEATRTDGCTTPEKHPNSQHHHFECVARPPLHASIVRIFNSFGPGMGEHDRRILPRIASAMVASRELKVFKPQGAQALPKRTYTPVANTLLGFMLVALKGESCGRPDRRGVNTATGVYNIGLDSPELSVPGLISAITRVTDNPVKYSLEPAPEHYETEPLRRAPDITKLKGLGFMPCMDLDTGLKLFFRWALAEYKGIE